MKKDADINFIADVLILEKEENIKQEEKNIFFGCYLTCLDFLKYIYVDMLTMDYHFEIPEKT